jgi:LPS export ABC transporter protein LptC
MSSPIELDHTGRLHRLSRRAVWRGQLAKWFALLALLVGLGIAALFLYQAGAFHVTSAELASVTIEKPVSQELAGTQMTFNGVDQQGFAFSISAEKATQDPTEKDVVHLTLATGAFARSAGPLHLSAQTALYNTTSKELHLSGHVVFEQQGRYKAQMERALMDVNSMNLSSQSKVHVELSNGSVDADHLDISENGKKTLFTGHVKANLQSDVKANIQPEIKSEVVP